LSPTKDKDRLSKAKPPKTGVHDNAAGKAPPCEPSEVTAPEVSPVFETVPLWAYLHQDHVSPFVSQNEAKRVQRKGRKGKKQNEAASTKMNPIPWSRLIQ
jgi:hypothetical protein